jgi:hypothetical protein
MGALANGKAAQLHPRAGFNLSTYSFYHAMHRRSLAFTTIKVTFWAGADAIHPRRLT